MGDSKLNMEAMSNELNAGMAAYREATGGPAEVDAIMTMADIVLEQHRDAAKDK